MHIFKVKNKDISQKMAIILIIRIIRYINLELEKYNTWNVKINCKPRVWDVIIPFLEIISVFNNEFIKIVDFWISISVTNFCIRDQISLMEDRKEKKYIEKSFYLLMTVLLIFIETLIIIPRSFYRTYL